MSSEFKKVVLEWNAIHQKIKETNEQIAPFQKKIKAYRERADGLENKILDYMRENRMNNSKMEVGDVVITMGETKRTDAMSRDYLLQKTKEFFRDDKLADRFVSYVYDNRQQTVSNVLKRKENKPKNLVKPK